MGNAPQEKIYDIFVNSINVISMSVSIVGFVLVFLQVSIWLSILFLIVLLAMMWLVFKAMDKMNTMFNNQSEEERRMGYYAELITEKHPLYELLIFGAVPYIIKKWRNSAEHVLNERKKVTVQSQKYTAVSCLCILLWLAVVLVSLIAGIKGGVLSLGLFVSFVGSANSAFQNTEKLSYSFSNLSQKYLQMKHYHIFMKLPERTVNSNDTTVISAPFSICFDRVTFRYPNTEKEVLHNVSFQIDSTQKTAIVGENGAGKSTIIKLLCRLYKPDSGKITINGVDLFSLGEKEYHKLFSVVFQDFGKYNLTLRENVALGDVDEIDQDDKVKKALIEGMADQISSDLDANLGKIEENGIDLSGGQWQRLAIARGCFANSAVIILDEPTSALDPIAENKMYQSFLNVMQDKGCIIISHRLASAKMCDSILVLHNGQILESGTHQELMAHHMLYEKMFSAQSKWYTQEDCNDENEK